MNYGTDEGINANLVKYLSSKSLRLGIRTLAPSSPTSPFSNITTPAVWASARLAKSTAMFDCPAAATFVTVPMDGCNGKSSAFDLQRASGHESMRDFAPPFRQDALERRSRDPHHARGVFLMIGFQIGQTKRFQLFVE